MTYGVLVAQSEIALSVALCDLNSIVNVLDGHSVVGNVLDASRTTSSLQVGRKGRSHARPDLDASTILNVVLVLLYVGQTTFFRDTYRGIEHRNVVDENVLDDIDFILVLAQGANGDTVRAIAVEVLDDDVGAVGLEGNAV